MTAKTIAGADSRRDDPPAGSDTLTVVLGALYDLNRNRDADTLAQKIVTVVPRTIACDSAIFARIEPATLSFTFSSWPADRFAAVDQKDVSPQLERSRLPRAGRCAWRDGDAPKPSGGGEQENWGSTSCVGRGRRRDQVEIPDPGSVSSLLWHGRPQADFS